VRVLRGDVAITWVAGYLLVGGMAGQADAGAASDLLLAGPMPAYSSFRSAAVWLQTERPTPVEIRFHPEGQPEAARQMSLATSDPLDGIAMFVLDGLEPGTTYEVELTVDGTRVERPYPFQVKTQPLWQWRTEAPDFTALFGSCAYVNDTPYDRPGKPYGNDFEVFDAMAAQRADLMLWVGDNVYLREVDFHTPEGIRYRYRHSRALPALQRFLASTHHYATWDDHDFGPNDSDGSYALKGASLETFRRYWPAPQYGLPDTPGVFQRVTWADVEFFLLDDRYHRKPNRWPDGPDKTMLGRAQINWLKESLVGSRASFKVVVLGNQVLNPQTRHEGLFHFGADLDELLDWILGQRIDGVLFLSGDRHKTELIRLEPDGGYPLYDFTDSPLTAGVYSFGADDPEAENSVRVDGTLLTEHGFGSLRFEGTRQDRRVTLRACAKDGAVRWQRVIPRKELTFP